MPALSSCVKEEEFASPVQGKDNLIITATHEGAGPATRTELVGGSTYWSVGDKISVFFGSGTAGGAEFTSLNTEPSPSADFTGILTAVTGSENGSSSKKYFWGVYPYSENNSVTLNGSSNYLTTVVNDTQYGVADSFSAGQNIWIGRDPGLELSFKSLLSGIKFTFSREDIVGITIKGNNGEYLAGKVNVVMDSGVPEVSDVVEGKTTITLKPENGGTFQTGAIYRALFLPTNFTQGLTVTFYTLDGNVGRRTYGILNFERNKPKNAPNADSKATWELHYVEMAPGFYWATCNVGADNPWDHGDYFAWGETEPKSNYTWDTYAFGTEDNLTKYNGSDGKTALTPEDDAATQNWGGHWRMPTKEEWQALRSTDKFDWTWDDTRKGYTVTSKVSGYEGNSIFLPTGGFRAYASTYYDTSGRYWSSTYFSNSYGYGLQFDGSGGMSMGGHFRCYGQSVRPVYDPTTINGHEYVDMGNGLKGATTNVGAGSPEEYGDYFAWGETAPKDEYSWATYAHMESGQSDWKHINKYTFADGQTGGIWYDGDGNFIGDNKESFADDDYKDDAARKIWGSTWRTPTYAEWTWLLDNCDWAWTDDYEGTGVAGRVVTSNVPGFEDSSIFLPAAGHRNGTSLLDAGSYGGYWPSSLSTGYSDCAYYVDFDSDNVSRNYDYYRFNGLSVRPVSE